MADRILLTHPSAVSEWVEPGSARCEDLLAGGYIGDLPADEGESSPEPAPKPRSAPRPKASKKKAAPRSRKS